MNNEKFISEITEHFSILSNKVELQASLNLLSLNIHCEQFCKELLNLIFSYNLINSNFSEQNATAIDLIDQRNRIAIQVTSDNSFEKIKKTFNKFLEKNLHLTIDRLVILILVDKKNYQKSKLDCNKTNFSLQIKEDIWDFKSLVRQISHKDIEPLQEIHSLVCKYLDGNHSFKTNTSHQVDAINSSYGGQKTFNETMLFKVLDKITNLIENTQIVPSSSINLPYDIGVKIAYNEIKCYERDRDIYEDGMYRVIMRLKEIEDNSDGSIKPKLFNYVNSIFRDIRNRNPDYSSTKIVCSVEDKIREQLQSYDKQSFLSPEDLTHVEHIVYYVFASCKIFDRPPQTFIDRDNVNSE